MTRYDWDDIALGLLMLWTLVGCAGMLVGLHLGWWDLLVAWGVFPPGYLPANPRYAL